MKNINYINRRKKLLSQIEKGVIFLPASSLKIRSNDTEFPFRQDSNFYYLCGFNEPDAVLLLYKDKKNSKTVIFLRDKDPKEEMWIGKRLGVKDAPSVLGVDEAYDISLLEKQLPRFLENQTDLYIDNFTDNRYLSTVKKVSAKLCSNRDIFLSPINFKHINGIIEKMRLVKQSAEIKEIKKAVSITTMAHHAAMAYVKPGLKEYEIQALIEYVFKKNGSKSVAYETIAASGNRANTLHYIENSKTLKNNELLLIDAGCEWNNYASDITRTIPVNKTFSKEQQLLYEAVLDVQLKIINSIKPGVSKKSIQDMSESLLAEVMIKIGVLRGSLDEILETKQHKKYYPHGIGHWMGMDVHDVCPYKDEQGRDILFEKGMILTVEPAIYLPEEDLNIPQKFRGVGIRIEDNILVTSKGYENLSSNIAKTVAEIEGACKEDYRQYL